MTEKKVVNRVVVTDETGEVVRQRTDAEIVEENEVLEESLRGRQEDRAEQVDLSVIQMLKEKKAQKEEVFPVVKKDRSLNFGVVGLGQAGNRIAETFYSLGYEACAFNTATQDLEHIQLPENKKVYLPFALGGAGKELDNGRAAVENNAEMILEKLQNIFGNSEEMIILAISGGGGTGSGGAEAIIGLLSTLGKPIGVIYILPMESEDSLAKHNAVTTLGRLAKMATGDVITTLMVVDNSKIDIIYSGLSKGEFWNTANSAIVEPLHLFNHLSAMPTRFESLDPMDFVRLFTAGDCTIYGQLEVENYMETTAIAEAIIENLEGGLLASDFNLKETRFGGFIITASKEVLDKLPAVNISYASHMISDLCNSPQLVKGVYEVESDEDVVTVYTMFSGLGLPAGRIETLKSEAQEQMAVAREKEKSRSEKMLIEYNGGNETKAKTEEIHRMIKQKKSAFGQITNNANKFVRDRRRR